MSSVDELVDNMPVCMTTEVEIPWYSINFKISLHPTALLLLDVLYDSIQHLIIAHMLIAINISFGERVLVERMFNVNDVNFEHVLDIK